MKNFKFEKSINSVNQTINVMICFIKYLREYYEQKFILAILSKISILFQKTARLGNLHGLSSLETPFSEYGRISTTKVIQFSEMCIIFLKFNILN